MVRVCERWFWYKRYTRREDRRPYATHRTALREHDGRERSSPCCQGSHYHFLFFADSILSGCWSGRKGSFRFLPIALPAMSVCMVYHTSRSVSTPSASSTLESIIAMLDSVLQDLCPRILWFWMPWMPFSFKYFCVFLMRSWSLFARSTACARPQSKEIECNARSVCGRF